MINPISLIKCISCICLLILTISCNTIENSEEARCKVIPFELTDVKLLDGPFKHATELNKKSLLAYNPDRLLSKFKSEAGQ